MPSQDQKRRNVRLRLRDVRGRFTSGADKIGATIAGKMGDMCGRFTLIRLSDFTNLFPWILPPDQEPTPRYNIAPTQPVAAAANTEPTRIGFFHFGLIPSWAKEAKIGSRMINARAETLVEKPAFRTALRRRRCLIPADGFYEWRKNPDGSKTPMYIRLKRDRPMAFAGLWDVWQSPDGSPVPSCTIITTLPNELVGPIHDRMPAVLREENYRPWLSAGDQGASNLLAMLLPYPADPMVATPVSNAVNSPKNDSPACIQPAL
jgi:putative SOS response-associated peptidase YedK